MNPELSSRCFVGLILHAADGSMEPARDPRPKRHQPRRVPKGLSPDEERRWQTLGRLKGGRPSDIIRITLPPLSEIPASADLYMRAVTERLSEGDLGPLARALIDLERHLDPNEEGEGNVYVVSTTSIATAQDHPFWAAPTGRAWP